jgi:hypothetical protein
MTNLQNANQSLLQKIAKTITELKPFQSLDYDPEPGLVSIITELLVPSDDLDQLVEIVSHCRANERLSVKRYADCYRVILVRQVKL